MAVIVGTETLVISKVSRPRSLTGVRPMVILYEADTGITSYNSPDHVSVQVQDAGVHGLAALG